MRSASFLIPENFSEFHFVLPIKIGNAIRCDFDWTMLESSAVTIGDRSGIGTHATLFRFKLSFIFRRNFPSHTVSIREVFSYFEYVVH